MNNCNGTTHSCCNNRLQKEGGKARCCSCCPHENCNLQGDIVMHEAICLHPIEEGHPQTATEVLGELREEEKRQGTRRQIHYKKFLEFLRDATKSGSWSKIECRQRLGELMEEANKLGYESGYAKRQEEILETGEAILQVWREGSIIKNI